MDVFPIPLQGAHAIQSGKTTALISARHAAHVVGKVWILSKDGYAHTLIDGTYYIKLHQLIWSKISGQEKPFVTADGLPGVVDHINRDRLDNRDCNLRCITTQQNNWNRSMKEDACIKQMKDGTFQVKLKRGGETLQMKGIATKEEARALRDAHMF